MGESKRKNLRQSGQAPRQDGLTSRQDGQAPRPGGLPSRASGGASPAEPAALSRRQRQQQIQRRARRKKTLIITAIVLAVVIILGPLTLLSTGAFYRIVPAAEVGGRSYSISDFNYHYYSALQSNYENLQKSYGDYASYILDPKKPLNEQQFSEDMTWADYLGNSALMNIQNVVLLNDQAKAAGYTLSEEQEAELTALYEQIKTTAASYNYSLNGYLQAVYGNGMTPEIFQRNLRDSYVADAYAGSVVDSYQYSAEDLQAHYEANKNNFDAVTYRLFFVSGAAAEGEDAAAALAVALEKAKVFAGLADSSESFAQLALEYAAEDSKEKYQDPDATLNRDIRYSAVSGTTYGEWLFDAARQPGDTTVSESSSGHYVLYFEGRSDNHYNTVNVRHLLITPKAAEDGGEVDEAAWAKAEQEINALYDQWKAGEATEESFAALANEHSADGDGTTGGLYEGVYKGQMVRNFNDWCFDPARAPGDTGIVKTDYGYHIIYFVGEGGDYWTRIVTDSLKQQDYSAWILEKSALYEIKTSPFGMRFAKNI